MPSARTSRPTRSTVTSAVGVGLGQLPQRVHGLLRQNDREQAVLERVAAEDVGEAGGDDGLEAVVLQRPHGVLARGAGAEVGAGDQDRGALCARAG